jgi:hypothetical protein
MDEVDLDEFLREASEAIEDPDKLAEFVREKSTIAIERFLVRRERYKQSLSDFVAGITISDIFARPLLRIIFQKCRFLSTDETSETGGY